MRLFLVGQNRGYLVPWEVQGIFDSEEKAIAACLDETYFVGPLVLNEPLPAETHQWKGAYYPKAIDQESR